jgi:radical SAM superfamily enzyme YgiQ (UPF0313 family)
MRVLLINPPFLKNYSRQSRSPCVTKSGTLYYPYFLAYATGAVEKVGFEAKLVDSIISDLTAEETADIAKSFGPGLIVIDTSTPSIYNDARFAEALKKEMPDAHITLVGTFPTNMPEYTLKLSKAIDSVCRGEYDYTVVELAKTLKYNGDLKSVKGLAYLKSGKIVLTEPRPLIANLDELPFVSAVYKKHFGEALMKKYFYASITWPYIQVLTARGCPYNCAFCNSPFKNSYRARSIQNVAGEFDYIRKELPFVKEVMLEDETFPAQKQRTLELCAELVKRESHVKWSCNARVNTDIETLNAMKAAGCRLLCVGFESAVQTQLNSVSKGTTKDMQSSFMEDTRRAKLLVNGCFILGLPDDTAESMQATIDFAKELNPNTAQFYPLMVYPGTKAYEWAKEKGYVCTEDFSKWITPEGLHNTTVSRPGLTDKELIEWCNKARLQYYTGGKYLAKVAKQALTNPNEAIRILKGGKVLSKHLLRTAMKRKGAEK